MRFNGDIYKFTETVCCELGFLPLELELHKFFISKLILEMELYSESELFKFTALSTDGGFNFYTNIVEVRNKGFKKVKRRLKFKRKIRVIGDSVGDNITYCLS